MSKRYETLEESSVIILLMVVCSIGIQRSPPDCRCIVVSMDERPRILQGYEILPANDFLRKLWNDEIVDTLLL